MPATSPRLFPLEPLLAATGLTQTRLQRKVHASGKDMARAAREGCTAAQADMWAVRCNLHPFAVWGWQWVDTAENPTDERTPAA